MMINFEKRKSQKGTAFMFPIQAAQKFIRLFQEIKHTNEEQTAMLATAYYILATFQNISANQNKMHLNAAIALLKKIDVHKRRDSWSIQIAHAYFKRAELLEEKQDFILAIHDYNQVIEVFEENSMTFLDDEDHLLVAQAAISIADIIVSNQIDNKNIFSQPLSYINKALEYLAKIVQYDDDVLMTEAYAHQIAGIALSTQYFEEAIGAFRIAISTAFKVNTLRVFPLLADIYTCLGLLYEQHYQHCPIQKVPGGLLDQAMVYFSLSLLFSPNELGESEDNDSALELLFEMIYRVLNPYLFPFSLQITCDVIDALIYLYVYNLDNSLPNEELSERLKEPETLSTYTQHLYWLIIEAYRKKYPRTQFYELFYPNKMDVRLEINDVLSKVQSNRISNVYYLKNQRPALKNV